MSTSEECHRNLGFHSHSHPAPHRTIADFPQQPQNSSTILPTSQVEKQTQKDAVTCRATRWKSQVVPIYSKTSEFSEGF